MTINEKQKAKMYQQKSKFDDNMKDLTYMELIAGSKGQMASNAQSQESFTPVVGLSECSPVS